MFSGTSRSSTATRRFLRPPIWPSLLALAGLACKKQRPPSPAAARHALPVLVLPLHVNLLSPLPNYFACVLANNRFRLCPCLLPWPIISQRPNSAPKVSARCVATILPIPGRWRCERCELVDDGCN